MKLLGGLMLIATVACGSTTAANSCPACGTYVTANATFQPLPSTDPGFATLTLQSDSAFVETTPTGQLTGTWRVAGTSFGMQPAGYTNITGGPAWLNGTLQGGHLSVAGDGFFQPRLFVKQ